MITSTIILLVNVHGNIPGVSQSIDGTIKNAKLKGLEFAVDLCKARATSMVAPPKPFVDVAEKVFRLMIGPRVHSQWLSYTSVKPLIGNRGDEFQIPIVWCKFQNRNIEGYFYFSFVEVSIILDGIGSSPEENFDSQNRIALQILRQHTTWKVDSSREKLVTFGDTKPFEPTPFGPIKCNWVAVRNQDGKINSGGNDVGRRWDSLVNFRFAKNFTMMQIMVTQWYDAAFGNGARDILIGEPNQKLSAVDEKFWQLKMKKPDQN